MKDITTHKGDDIKGSSENTEGISTLRIIYMVDENVIKEVEKKIDKKEKWFWLGNAIWRGF